MPDLVEAAKNADMLVFVVPHQFIQGFCNTLAGKIKPDAIGISLIKVSLHTHIYDEYEKKDFAWPFLIPRHAC